MLVPQKADAVLTIDTDAVLSGAVALEGLEHIARDERKVAKRGRCDQGIDFSSGKVGVLGMDRPARSLRRPSVGDVGRTLVVEPPEAVQGIILACNVIIDKMTKASLLRDEGNRDSVTRIWDRANVRKERQDDGR